MRRNNTQSLGDVLRDYVDAMKMRRRLKESRIKTYWISTVGEYAASLTRNIELKNGTLTVSLDSSVLRNELLMMREKLVKSLNTLAEEELVLRIVLK